MGCARLAFLMKGRHGSAGAVSIVAVRCADGWDGKRPGGLVSVLKLSVARPWGGGSSDRMTHDGANLQFDLVLGLWFGSVFYFGYIFGVDLWSTWFMGGQRQHCVCARKAYLIYIG